MANAITTDELIAALNSQAKEIADAGHAGWGNTMSDAARALQQYVSAIDAICSDSDAARDAVTRHFGLWHRVQYTADSRSAAVAAKNTRR